MYNLIKQVVSTFADEVNCLSLRNFLYINSVKITQSIFKLVTHAKKDDLKLYIIHKGEYRCTMLIYSGHF